MDTPPLPEKPYFRIGEVAEILGVETYVLRYWESEFPQLKPVRAPSRQRLYRRADVETLLYIKGLLHEQGYTIAGAKRRLAEEKGIDDPTPVKGQQAFALVPPQPRPAKTKAKRAPAAPPAASATAKSASQPLNAPALAQAVPETQPRADSAPQPPSPVVKEVLDELRELLKRLS